MAMDCLLCSSPEGEVRSKPTAAAADEINRNHSNHGNQDNGCHGNGSSTSSPRNFGQCFCQLLGLPATPFQDNLLASSNKTIGFCSSCTNFLTNVNALFDQLDQLQLQIQVDKVKVSQRLKESVVSDRDRETQNWSALTSAQTGDFSAPSLRIEVLRALQDQNFDPDPGKIVSAGGFIVDDVFKEEILDDLDLEEQQVEDIVVHPLETFSDWSPDPSPCPPNPPSPINFQEEKVDLPGQGQSQGQGQFCPSPSSSVVTAKPKPKRPSKSRRRKSKLNPRAEPTLSQKLFAIQQQLQQQQPQIPPSPPSSLTPRTRKVVHEYEPEIPELPAPAKSSWSRLRPGGAEPSLSEKLIAIQQKLNGAERPCKVSLTRLDRDRDPQVKVTQVTTTTMTTKTMRTQPPTPTASSIAIAQRQRTTNTKKQATRVVKNARKMPGGAGGGDDSRRSGAPTAGLMHKHRPNILRRPPPVLRKTAGAEVKVKVKIPRTRVRKPRAPRIRPKRTVFRCTICGEEFSSSSAKQTHLRVAHSVRTVRKKVKCPECSKPCFSGESLKAHIRTHTGEIACICEECGRCFKSALCLRRHMPTHSSVRPHPCPHCPKAFVRKDHFDAHLLRMHQNSRDFMCEFCSRAFKASYDLVKHQKKMHPEKFPGIPAAIPGDRPFKCQFDECAKNFATESHLKQHENWHYRCNSNSTSTTCTPRAPAQCKLCEFSVPYESRARLNAHVRWKHSDPRFPCGQCAKNFHYPFQLRHHFAIAHSAERPFECSECPKKFKLAVLRANHFAVVHSGLKPFKCPICGEDFPLQKYVDRHVQKIHGGAETSYPDSGGILIRKKIGRAAAAATAAAPTSQPDESFVPGFGI